MTEPFHATFEIQGRPVGGGAPCYVIAEAGANHNRDLGIARELIDVAVSAGADAVKFQVYSGTALYSTKTPRFTYLKGINDKATHEVLEDAALPREWIPDLAAYCTERNITFFATPFDARAVEELTDVGVPVMKIASFELVDLGLIRAAAGSGVPLILSTGMATYGEVEDALGAAAEGGARDVALLRCASLYPSPPNIMNLKAMKTMRRAFGVPVGLSDHTTGVAIPAGAAALGMDILEKHFTLSRDMDGPDHPFAIEPDELRAMVKAVRDVEAALGSGRLEGPSALEAEEMYRLARRSIVAATDIPAGTVLAAEHLTVKRPGFGIKPKYLDSVVGRTAKVDIEEDDILLWDML